MKSNQTWDDGSPVDRSKESLGSRSKKSDKFTARDAAVCRQAQRTLLIELLTIPGITSIDVQPVVGVARLRVQITARPADLPHIQTLLLQRAPALRHAITSALRRRKAPELTFTFLPEGGAR